MMQRDLDVLTKDNNVLWISRIDMPDFIPSQYEQLKHQRLDYHFSINKPGLIHEALYRFKPKNIELAVPKPIPSSSSKSFTILWLDIRWLETV